MELPEPFAKRTAYRPYQSQGRRSTIVPYRGEVGFQVLCCGEVFLDLRVRRGTEVVKTGRSNLYPHPGGTTRAVLFSWLGGTCTWRESL